MKNQSEDADETADEGANFLLGRRPARSEWQQQAGMRWHEATHPNTEFDVYTSKHRFRRRVVQPSFHSF